MLARPTLCFPAAATFGGIRPDRTPAADQARRRARSFQRIGQPRRFHPLLCWLRRRTGKGATAEQICVRLRGAGAVDPRSPRNPSRQGPRSQPRRGRWRHDVLLAGTASGGINAVECRVRGLFFTSAKAYDDSALRIPLVTARELMRTVGSHYWVILLDATEGTAQVAADLRREFAGQPLEFTPWTELADFYNKTAVFSAVRSR